MKDNNYMVFSYFDNKKVMVINMFNLRWKIYTELIENKFIIALHYLSPISVTFLVMCITFYSTFYFIKLIPIPSSIFKTGSINFYEVLNKSFIYG